MTTRMVNAVGRYRWWLRLVGVVWLVVVGGGPGRVQAEVAVHPLAASNSALPGEALFEALSAERTGVSFQLQFPDMARHIHELIHLSLYGGICTGDYDGDGWTDFYVTSPVGGNRLYRNLGDFRFEDVTEAAGLLDPAFWGTGAVMADINNDGNPDIYACGYRMPNRLFLNRGMDASGVVGFEECAAAYGLAFEGGSMTMAFADMDRDGDLDGYLATTAVPPPPSTKLRLEHDGTKSVVPRELQEYWTLFELPDGRLIPAEAGQFDHLYRNDGDRFVEVTRDAGIDGACFTLSAIWWDHDGDGWPDLYVSNDYKGPDMLYRNNRDGTFTDIIRETVSHTPWASMGTDVGDLNGDGLVDLMATDMIGSTHARRQIMLGDVPGRIWFLEYAEPRQYGWNVLYLNTGAGRMMEGAQQAGVDATDWTWAPRIADFDNDGREDLLFCNGMLRDVQHSDLGTMADRTFGGNSRPWAEFWAGQPLLTETNLVFRNLGNLQFERVERAWGLDRCGVTFGAATADFDNDGRLDLVVSNAEVPVTVYRNRARGGNRLTVRLRGVEANRFGVGATVRIHAGGTTQVRYAALNRGWLSASDPLLHFGLGEAETVEWLEVDWPSGRAQRLPGVPANRHVVITEPAGEPAYEPAAPAAPWFRESGMLRAVDVPEAPYDDFLREPLLHKRLSARGGKMAWGDLDGDGHAEVYVAATPGVEDRLFRRAGADAFAVMPQPAIAANADCEDADAAFADFDGDGDLDLFVAGGGVRAPGGHASYRHRLYQNDGKGGLTEVVAGILPAVNEGAGCLAVLDADGDGRLDLFLGGASVPGQYPLSGASHLWVQQGGRFVDATPDAMRASGIVTGAAAADLNGDGRSDLALAVNWGPIRVFLQGQAGWEDATEALQLGGLSGLWTSLAAGDLDGDGDIDLVAGNEGLNTQAKASPGEPEMLFYGDLDGSGRRNLLRAFFIDGYGFPHEGLAMLSKAMPLLSDRVTSHEAFASMPIEALFGMDRLRAAVRREADTLESGAWINDGSAGFQFRAFPWQAQLSPARALALLDVDGDEILDLVIGQNDFSAAPSMGRLDGGVSMVLAGDGQGGFTFVRPDRSGIVIGGEVRDLALVDLDGDGSRDLVFHARPEGMRAYLHAGPSP